MPAIDTVAWVRLECGKILGTRSQGKDRFYIPGGKREPGESDVQTLVREVAEELAVAIRVGSHAHVGTFEAQAHGQPDGVLVRMACYTADYDGTLAASGEIGELGWLSYTDRDRVPPVDQLVFDHLHRAGKLPV